MSFLHNAWYVAARRGDVTCKLQRRIILNEPVLIYRAGDNRVVAIQDRCPHRFAPLSAGTLKNNVVECKYHGLQFDRGGVCVHNPQGKANPSMNIRPYSVVERHGFIWIWMGDAAHADADRIPNLSLLEATDTRTVYSYFRADYRHDVLVDNLLDLSHTDYLHFGSFSAGKAELVGELQVTEAENDVIINRTEKDKPAPPMLASAGRVDIYTDIHWRPGHVISFEMKFSPAGKQDATIMKINFGHVATPETVSTTHYFLWLSRNYQIDDPVVDAEVAASQVSVIQNEDGPILEAINAEMHGLELLEMRPVVLPGDAGALRVRRVMKRRLEEESSKPEGAASSLVQE